MTQQQLQSICDQKLQLAINNNDEIEIKKYQTIQQILTKTDAIKKLGVELSINILQDLGFSKTEAQNIYLSFIK
jgi:hypothetical protein